MDFPPYVRHPSLRPGDLVVALGVTIFPRAPYALLAVFLGGSQSWVHTGLKRLHHAGLADRNARRIRPGPFVEFLDEGLVRAFPPVLGPPTSGIPTAWVPPRLRSVAGRLDPRELPPAVPELSLAPSPRFVWPSTLGSCLGNALMPLRPNAAGFAARHPGLYRLLSLLDVIRVDGPDRPRAFEILEFEIGAARRRPAARREPA